jgi:hypothetical protein
VNPRIHQRMSFKSIFIDKNLPKGENYAKIEDLVLNPVDMIPSENLNAINPNELSLNQHINFLLDAYINYDHLHLREILHELEHL